MGKLPGRRIAGDRGKKSDQELSGAVENQREVALIAQKLEILVAKERKGRESSQKADGDEEPDLLPEGSPFRESHDKSEEQRSEGIRGKRSPQQPSIVHPAKPLKHAEPGDCPDSATQRNFEK